MEKLADIAARIEAAADFTALKSAMSDLAKFLAEERGAEWGNFLDPVKAGNIYSGGHAAVD